MEEEKDQSKFGIGFGKSGKILELSHTRDEDKGQLPVFREGEGGPIGNDLHNVFDHLYRHRQGGLV